MMMSAGVYRFCKKRDHSKKLMINKKSKDKGIMLPYSSSQYHKQYIKVWIR